MSKPLGVDMSGKIVIVTGATTGIGKEIARGAARLGATVVLGARDELRGATAREEIGREAGDGRVHAMRLDVADMASVRRFAADFSKRFGTLDVLVNNAGAWFTDRRESPDGHELTFATNVLGPYLLTSLLRGALAGAAPSRIVNVVSSLAGNYDADDLQFSRRKFDGFKAYAQSKQALRMLTWGLAARLDPATTTANAAAPGFVRTEFNRNAKGLVATMIGLSARLFAVSPEQGADTPLWAAVAPELAGVTGKYFDQRKEKDGRFREVAGIEALEAECARLAGEPVKRSIAA